MLTFDGIISAWNKLEWDFSFKFSDIVSFLSILATLIIAKITLNIQREQAANQTKTLNLSMYEERKLIADTVLLTYMNITDKFDFNLPEVNIKPIANFARVRYFLNIELTRTVKDLVELYEKRQNTINSTLLARDEKLRRIEELGNQAELLKKQVGNILNFVAAR